MHRNRARAQARTAIYRLCFEPGNSRTIPPWERKVHPDFRERLRPIAVDKYTELHKVAAFGPMTKAWLERDVFKLTEIELKRIYGDAS